MIDLARETHWGVMITNKKNIDSNVKEWTVRNYLH